MRLDWIGVLFGEVWCQYSLLSSSRSVCFVLSVKEATSCSYNSQYALSIVENFLFLKFQSYRTAMNILRKVVNLEIFLILNNGWGFPPIFLAARLTSSLSEHYRMDRSASMRLRPATCRLKQFDSVLDSDEKTILCWLQENISDLNTKLGQEEETFLHRSA